MGLDMYLHARRYVTSYFDNEMFKQLKGALPPMPPSRDSVEIVVEVCYWRKANAIHRWFVQNIQNGEDDCKNYGVEVSELLELRELCADLLKNKDPKEAAERLPTAEGFFFGRKDYDESYWETLQDTVDQLNVVLTWNELRRSQLGRDYSDVDYSYSSSW